MTAARSLIASGSMRREPVASRSRRTPRRASLRWLLRNRESLANEAQQVRLDELLQDNQARMTAYVLRDDLKQLWRYRHPGYARRAWDGWYQRAKASGVQPIMQFAQRLKPYPTCTAYSMAIAYKPHRRHQQPHQGHQANSLWLSGRGIFLPQDQSRFPRVSANNQKRAAYRNR